MSALERLSQPICHVHSHSFLKQKIAQNQLWLPSAYSNHNDNVELV